MQGFNMGRYYPPSEDSPPTFNKTSHPLGSRANKISQGILTVRFELPFAVWCTSCKPEAIIGQGVRFNAEKRKVGNYYSTPIWAFRMKHTACGGWWEIRTDPKSTEYIVTEGARKRDYGTVDRVTDGEMAMLTEEERERRREDAFAKLEGRVEEKGAEQRGKERVEELLEEARVWEDPYTQNQRLRRKFRAERKVLEKEERWKDGVREKYGLELEIADEIETDGMRAGLVDFGVKERGVEDAERKPLFGVVKEGEGSAVSGPKTKKLKAEIRAEKSRTELQSTLLGNTRATMNPFVESPGSRPGKPKLGILKRKRIEGGDAEQTTVPATSLLPAPTPSIDTKDKPGSKEEPDAGKVPPKTSTGVPLALVDYDSD